jgi:hypothetical protein
MTGWALRNSAFSASLRYLFPTASFFSEPCKKSFPTRSNRDVMGGNAMVDRLRSMATRIREVFFVRRRLVLTLRIAAGVFVLFSSVSKQIVEPEGPSAKPLVPDRGSSNSEYSPVPTD